MKASVAAQLLLVISLPLVVLATPAWNEGASLLSIEVINEDQGN